VVAALLRKVLAIGFFYALLLNGGTWIRAAIQGFSQAGSSASGLADLSPTGVFDQGLALANKILNAVEGLGILEAVFPSLVAALTAFVVVVSFAIIAAQLLVALVESFIVIGAGILFVGFSGARWTKFFTERYLRYVATLGRWSHGKLREWAALHTGGGGGGGPVGGGGTDGSSFRPRGGPTAPFVGPTAGGVLVRATEGAQAGASPVATAPSFTLGGPQG